MDNVFIFVGIGLIFLGILVLIIGSILGGHEGKVEYGIGGFIGPIPFGWASSRPMLYVVIALSVLMLIAFFVMGFLGH